MVSQGKAAVSQNKAAAENLHAAPRVLACGAALILVASVTTFGLIRVNQQRPQLASEIVPHADGRPTADGTRENDLADTGRRPHSTSHFSQQENSAQNFAPPAPSASVPDVWPSSVGPGGGTSSELSPYNSAMRWAGSESVLASARGTGDARLERIERQLSQVLQNVDQSKATLANSSPMRQAASTAPAAIPATIPASLAAAVAESARAAANESEIRRELSDLRVTSEVELRELRQKLAGLSEQQKQMQKSLRKKPMSRLDETPSARHSPAAPVATPPEASPGLATTQPTTKTQPTANPANDPAETTLPPPPSFAAPPKSSEPLPAEEADEIPSGVTVVSELPLRVSVHTRSTSLSQLLAEFAKATGSGLVISTDVDQEIQAISLSEIAPQILFDLLCQNQNFEIQYEAKRVELRSRKKIPATGESATGLAALNAAQLETETRRETETQRETGAPFKSETPPATPPEFDASPISTPSDDSRPSVQKEPSDPMPLLGEPALKDSVAARVTNPMNSVPQPVSIPGSASLNLSEPIPAPASTYPMPELPATIDENSQSAGVTSPGFDNRTPTIPTPAELPRELTEPAVSTASSRNRLSGRSTIAAAPTPATALRGKQTYRLNATVLHLVATEQQNVQPMSFEPIRLHGSRTPGHQSAAQQVADQAAKLGRTTPVSDASVSLVEGQSARLKIGWLCLHCNDESGVAAGDDLRVTLERTEFGQPRLIVNGLAANSDTSLTTLDTLQADMAHGQSMLITEAGTGGNVSLRDDSSKLARLPFIGRAFRKSKQIHQTAQRLIVLTATPIGLDEATLETVASQQESVTGPSAEPASYSEPLETTAPVEPPVVKDRMAQIFARSENRDRENSTISDPRVPGANPALAAEVTIPHRSSHQPRKPHCKHCESTVRSLPQLQTLIADRDAERGNASAKPERLFLEARPVAFEAEPIIREVEPVKAAAPMIDLPLPASF